MLIDTHAHLQDKVYSQDQAAVMTRAKNAGVELIIVVSYDESSSWQAVSLAAQHDCIFAVVGVHPHDACNFTPATAQVIKQLTAEKKVVAIGEIGLDYYRNLSPKDVQRQAFIAQLDLARELGLPVVVHSREATNEVIDILRKYTGLTGVIHCFSGNRSEAEELVGLGYLIGITGVVTFPRSLVLQDAVKYLPADKLLLETDAPYLAPQQHRGGRNEPSYLVHMAAKVAELRNTDSATIARQTTANAARLFKLPLAGV